MSRQRDLGFLSPLSKGSGELKTFFPPSSQQRNRTVSTAVKTEEPASLKDTMKNLKDAVSRRRTH